VLIMIAIDLQGKTAVVTGGGQGLGKATAEILVAAGANVVINYLEDGDGLNLALAQEAILPFKERGMAVAADIRSRKDMENLFHLAAEVFGSIDILVNNAAILRDRTLKNLTDPEWDDVIETNLSAVFRVCQTALPWMNDGGRIVSMASISGVLGFFGQANYASAKAGIIAFTKVLSKELAARRITVNAVAPGVVLTEMGKSIPEAAREQMLHQIPLHRFGEPHEVASVILFLCSDLASYITGQTLHVNGGWWA
jgi:3-oxoacyl-[acyl-carrier protein] reductase